MRSLFDTSALRAALEESHQSHERALAWLEMVHRGEIKGIISTHVLAELYSNLTGQMRPLMPTIQALDLISRHIVPVFEIIHLTEEDYMAALERAARLDIRGGTIYDALIFQAAVKANAEQVVTFNARHFTMVGAGLPLRIVAP